MTVVNPIPASCITPAQYWCRSTLCVSITHAEGVTELLIERPYAIVGSHPHADVCLQLPGIPKRALLLYTTADGVFCHSLEKEYPGIGNGIHLLPDDVIDVDGYRLQVREQVTEELSDREALVTAKEQHLPEIAIVPQEGKRYKRRMKEALQVIGRNRNCELRLQEVALSACHCALLWYEHRLWAIDLLSGNGTLFQGQIIECVNLTIGDVVQLGTYRIVFYRSHQPEVPAPVTNETMQLTSHSDIIYTSLAELARTDEQAVSETPESVTAGVTIKTCVIEEALARVTGTPSVPEVAQEPTAQSPSVEATVPLVEEKAVVVVPAQGLEFQTAYDSSQAELGQLPGELLVTQSTLQKLQAQFESLQEEMTLVQQERNTALQLQQASNELNASLRGEVANLQERLIQQSQQLNKQDAANTIVITQLHADRARLSDQLATSTQQFATLNQSFHQLQLVVRELREETAQLRESRVITETPLTSLPSPLKNANIPLLQPQLGVLLRPTPAMPAAAPIPSLSRIVGKRRRTIGNEVHDAVTGSTVIDSTSSNASETPLATVDQESISTTPLRIKPKTQPDDKLTHFVSERLGQIESSRRTTTMVIWLVTFLFTAFLLVGAGILLKTWDLQPPQP